MSAYKDQEQTLIAREAARWLCLLAEDAPGTRSSFVAWLKRSPRHVEEFLMASAVLHGLDGAEPSDTAEIERLASQDSVSRGARNVVHLSTAGDDERDIEAGQDITAPRRPTVPFNVRLLAGLAAGVALLAIGFWAVPNIHSYFQTWTTATGEQRTVGLSDGSVVYLNAQSRMEVHFSAAARDVELNGGEALFKVAHDSHRPFRVHAGDAVIQAVGTQFDVYRRNDGTTVSVLEGKVQIAPDPLRSRSDPPPALGAGEQANIAVDGAVVKQSRVDLPRALAWRERRLVFRDDRLEDIAKEFGRYSSRRILPRDAAARSKTITGTFDADDPQSLVLFLQRLPDLTVQPAGKDFLVQGR